MVGVLELPPLPPLPPFLAQEVVERPAHCRVGVGQFQVCTPEVTDRHTGRPPSPLPPPRPQAPPGRQQEGVKHARPSSCVLLLLRQTCLAS